MSVFRRADLSPTRSLVVLPTYNEAENVLILVEEILALNVPDSPIGTLEILVVDDGSPDGTGALVRGAMASE